MYHVFFIKHTQNWDMVACVVSLYYLNKSTGTARLDKALSHSDGSDSSVTLRKTTEGEGCMKHRVMS